MNSMYLDPCNKVSKTHNETSYILVFERLCWKYKIQFSKFVINLQLFIYTYYYFSLSPNVLRSKQNKRIRKEKSHYRVCRKKAVHTSYAFNVTIWSSVEQ